METQDAHEAEKYKMNFKWRLVSLDSAFLQKGYVPSLSTLAQACDLIPRVWETRLLGKQRPELGRAGRSRDSG